MYSTHTWLLLPMADATMTPVDSHTATLVPRAGELSAAPNSFTEKPQVHVTLLVAVNTYTAPAPGPNSLSAGAPTAAKLRLADTA